MKTKRNFKIEFAVHYGEDGTAQRIVSEHHGIVAVRNRDEWYIKDGAPLSVAGRTDEDLEIVFRLRSIDLGEVEKRGF